MPTATRRFYRHEFVQTEYVDGESIEVRSEVYAFGQRIGYRVEFDARDFTGLPPLLRHESIRPWLVALPVALGLGLLLQLAIRSGSVESIVRQPGRASVAVTVSILLVLPYPYPASGGGGGSWPFITRWVVSDLVGSGVAVFDEDGAVVSQTQSEPFGGVHLDFSSGGADRRFYAGHPKQEKTGLTYMNARWMDPESGVFLSVDPLIVPSDPQSANAYTYARNNPVSLNDPTGTIVGCPGGCGGQLRGGSGFGTYTTYAESRTTTLTDGQGNFISETTSTFAVSDAGEAAGTWAPFGSLASDFGAGAGATLGDSVSSQSGTQYADTGNVASDAGSGIATSVDPDSRAASILGDDKLTSAANRAMSASRTGKRVSTT